MNIFEVMQYDVPRELMPQLDQDDVEKDHEVKRLKMPIKELITSQTDRNDEKVEKIKDKISNGKMKPIMIDCENRIVDGHHRYDACKDLNVKIVPVVKVNTTLPDLIQRYQHKTESIKYSGQWPFIKE